MTLPEWLKKCNCTEIRSVRVTIEGKEYEGCEYKQSTREPRIYCKGEVPKKLHNQTCFIRGSETWFSAGFMEGKSITRNVKDYHPFGANFMLMRWAHAEPIDHYENKPYTRVELKVEYV